MKEGYELWKHLEDNGIRLRVTEGKLMANGALTLQLREDIRRNKDYLIGMSQREGLRPVVAPFKVEWSRTRGWIRICDPFSGLWHEVPSKGLPRWVYDYLRFKGGPRVSSSSG